MSIELSISMFPTALICNPATAKLFHHPCFKVIQFQIDWNYAVACTFRNGVEYYLQNTGHYLTKNRVSVQHISVAGLQNQRSTCLTKLILQHKKSPVKLSFTGLTKK